MDSAPEFLNIQVQDLKILNTPYNLLFPISLQPDDGNLSYLKL